MAGSTIQRVQFSTRDPDEGEDYISQMYVDSLLTVKGVPGQFRFTSDLLTFDGVFIGQTSTSIAATVEAPDGIERLTVFNPREPLKIGPVGREHTALPGSAMCIPPEISYLSLWDDLAADIVTFAPGLVDDVAGAQLAPGQALRFDFAGAISPLAAEAWSRTYRLVRGVAAAQVGKDDTVLLVDELTRLLATTMLTCFGNTTMADRNPRPTRTAPASLRRAVAFIESHLDTPIRLDTLAEAARVSPRALNQTFNRHLGISPIGYVHRARLDRAHHDLVAAQPGDGQTVTAIAARWGFYDLPRFGVAYRRTYGRPPSQTLRNS